MIKLWLTKIIIPALLILTLASGGYAVKLSLEASSLRSEVSTLTDNLIRTEKALKSLNTAYEEISKQNTNLNNSIEIYINQLTEDNKHIASLRWELENVKDKEVNKCLNRVLVPSSITDRLYNKD